MIETKSIRVGTSQEQSMINDMACFGWNLQSSQEINSKESHLEKSGDTVYSVTTSEKYVKLVFNRDTKMPNYSKLVEYEKTYFSILASMPRPISGKKAFFGFLFFLIPGILYVVIKSVNKNKWKKKMSEIAYPARNNARALL